MRPGEFTHTPTPEEIEEATARIREGWTWEQAMQRLGKNSTPLELRPVKSRDQQKRRHFGKE